MELTLIRTPCLDLDDDVLLLFEAVDIRDPVVDLLLPVLLCGRVSEHSAVDRRDPVPDGCGSSLGGHDPSVGGRDPSLYRWELFVDARDPDCDPVLLPLLVTSSRDVLPLVLPVLLEASFTDDLLDDGRLSLVLLSPLLLVT